MEKYELQQLRNLPIERVAEQLGMEVARHKCLCPFHDDRHPSLSFRVSTNTFRCFVCGEHGGVIDLVMKYRNVGFLEACEWLGRPASPRPLSEGKGTAHKTIEAPSGAVWGGSFDASRYERFFLRPWLSPEAQRFLYEERRIDPRVVRWSRLTSWRDREGVEWLQIPYYASPDPSEGGEASKPSSLITHPSSLNQGDGNGKWKLVGVQNRRIETSPCPSEGGVSVSRFRFPAGSKCSIYNLQVLSMLKPEEPLYITEGASDCWAMLSAGHKAIAIPSATLLNPRDVERLSSLIKHLSTPLHMYPDRDEPGERLFLQLKALLPNLEHHQLPPDCKDFGEYWKRECKRAV